MTIRKIEADTMTAAADLAREYTVSTTYIVGAINDVLNAAEAEGWAMIAVGEIKDAARPEIDYIAKHGGPIENMMTAGYSLPEIVLPE